MSLDDDNNADIDIDSAGDRENDDNGVDDDDIMKGYDKYECVAMLIMVVGRLYIYIYPSDNI